MCIVYGEGTMNDWMYRRMMLHGWWAEADSDARNHITRIIKMKNIKNHIKNHKKSYKKIIKNHIKNHKII